MTCVFFFYFVLANITYPQGLQDILFSYLLEAL